MTAAIDPRDAQAAADCLRLYADAPQYDPYWDRVWPHNGGFAAMKRMAHANGAPVQRVVWRGSTTALDWWRNFEALPIDVPGLGPVHAGFWRGVCAAKDEIVAALDPKAKIEIVGHSRGAAEAALFAGGLAVEGWTVGLVTFGSPRPGYRKLVDVLAKGKVEIRQYKNLSDPVTEVPFAFDLIGTACDLPYEHVAPFVPLAVAPLPSDPWGAVAPHRMCLYAHGLGG